MSYIKSYSFIKRTFVLLSPLFLVTLASKELAFYSPSATLSPILSNPEEAKDSIIHLVNSLEEELPIGVENYGDLKISKNIFEEDLWIEETNSLKTFSHNIDFKFKEGEKIITKENSNKLVLKKTSFEEIQDKGDINVLITFDLVDGYSEPIPITHVISLSDLTTSSEKTYTVVSTKVGQSGDSKKHTLIVRKDPDKQEITFELSNNVKSQLFPSSNYFSQDLSSLIIKSFYILFNDNPPLDPNSYFFTNSSSGETIVGDSLGGVFKKVLINKWNNKNGNSKSQEEPKYEFNISKDSWKSTCSDPYKVGGFIDKSLPTSTQKSPSSLSEKIEGNGKSYLARQMKTWKEFEPFKKEDIHRTGQYYWKEIKDNGAYVPHDDSTTTYECKGVDSETKSKFKEYLSSTFKFEKVDKINTKLAPEVLIKEVEENGASTSSQEVKYPQHKIVQSSFRAWGNAYLTKWGENLKQGEKYSKPFELANQSNHSFEIKIDKATWIKYLIEEKLNNQNGSKKLNESQDVSSVLEVYYPLSFSFFDPISGYFKKNSLYLKTELDLSNLYLNSFFSKEVFRFDIERENRVIGQDYQGFDPRTNHKKKKDYGLDGVLSLIAGLELDIEKNLKINLTTRVSGFVNNKNPSCDLRHRLYKIDNGNFKSSKRLSEKWNCSSESGWSYRDHIHIPSYLIISLEKEPEVSSFYIDRQSGVSEVQEQKGTQIKTLSQLKSELDRKEITVTVDTDESTKADVYFRDIAVYNEHKEKEGFPLLDLSSWWSSGQNVYYWYPRRTKSKLTNISLKNVKSVTLHLSGSNNSYNAFFHSNHFNTLTTICLSNKSQSQGSGRCADGNSYEEEQKDKNPSELHELWGTQKIDVDLSQLNSKTSEDSALEVKFRVSYNRADRRDLSKKPKPAEDADAFDKISSKLEKFFKDSTENNPNAKDIPNVSMLAFWYSVFIWKNGSELHYATQVRPIGLTTKKIDNSSSHYTAGAAGSAGFQINKFEFKYSKNSLSS